MSGYLQSFVAGVRNERTELKAWRLFGADIMPLLEEALAAQGDRPDARLLKPQHELAELRAAEAGRLPANTNE